MVAFRRMLVSMMCRLLHNTIVHGELYSSRAIWMQNKFVMGACEVVLDLYLFTMPVAVNS